jgi:hypothetical protein
MEPVEPGQRRRLRSSVLFSAVCAVPGSMNTRGTLATGGRRSQSKK